jgi:hypothetical protein
MASGQVVYGVPYGPVKHRRRVSAAVAIVVMIAMLGYICVSITDPHRSERSASYLAADVIVPILMAIGILLVSSVGLKQNGFAVTTTGIYPPSKPNRKLFSGRYFIPYSDVESMDLVYLPYYDSKRKAQDTHPHAATMHLRGGKSVYVNVVGGWAPMYLYVRSETTMRGIYRMLEVIKREIDEQRAAGVKEIVIPAEKLRAAMKPKKGEHYVD